jgi:hypothetical protein
MGLDMYLEARKYVGRIDWKKVPKPLPEGANFDDYVSDEFETLKGLFPSELTENTDAGSSVAINAGYWRKANQIHGWFVQHVQDGVDDCGEYRVNREQLIELRDTVEKVLDGNKSTAKELLPVTGGFFFGNYDAEEGYDEYYYEQLKATKKILNNILKIATENNSEYEFYYSSSW